MFVDIIENLGDTSMHIVLGFKVHWQNILSKNIKAIEEYQTQLLLSQEG